MKTVVSAVLLALAVALFLAPPAPASSAATPAPGVETFKSDPAHSEVGFVVRHFVSKVRGRFRDFSAVIVKDDQDPSRSSVEFTIQVASIDTGVEKRDNHLRSADFFDAANYPQITFRSTRVEKVSDSEYRVTGDLTMRGVTKVVTLPVTYAGEMPDGFGGVRAGFSTTTTLNRQDFGIKWNKQLDTGGYMLSDEVEVEIDLEAVRQQ
jgi:polyisoprenoid-binding protein YceI